MTLINLILHCVQNYVFCNFLQKFVVEVVVVVKGWAILVFGYIKGEKIMLILYLLWITYMERK